MIFPSSYLPPVSYLRAMKRADETYLEVCEYYIKQTIRNRCWIDSPQGPLSLSVPVQKAEGKVAMRDVRISDHGNWRHQHWTALMSSYGQSPFYEFYADDFAPFYERKWVFLADFNEDLLRLVCQLMDIEVAWQRTTSYSNRHDWYMPSDEPVRPYYQSFSSRHGFLPDLSCIDLLFNMGPESVFYL